MEETGKITMGYTEIITASFAQIFSNSLEPIILHLELFKTLERFTCIVYDKSSEYGSVNNLKLQLFSRHSKLIENIPPTQVNIIYVNMRGHS